MINSSNNDLKFNRPIFINFRTNAKLFKVNFELSDVISGNYPHIGVTAREGISILYRRINEEFYYNVDVMSRHKSFTINLGEILPNDDFFEILIYGPILNKLAYLDIEISNEFDFEKINTQSRKNILIGGGIHSFGVGCTTSSVMFSNILGRKNGVNITNISQYDTNYLERLFDEYNSENLSNFDVGILELDYCNQNEDILDKYLLNVVDLFNSKCNHLIGWYTLQDRDKNKKDKINFLLSDYIKENRIIIKDLSYLYNAENLNKCTFGRNFINDTANIYIYKALNKIIGEWI